LSTSRSLRERSPSWTRPTPRRCASACARSCRRATSTPQLSRRRPRFARSRRTVTLQTPDACPGPLEQRIAGPAARPAIHVFVRRNTGHLRVESGTLPSPHVLPSAQCSLAPRGAQSLLLPAIASHDQLAAIEIFLRGSFGYIRSHSPYKRRRRQMEQGLPFAVTEAGDTHSYPERFHLARQQPCTARHGSLSRVYIAECQE